MKPTVFIDGREGTTGLQIYDRLHRRQDLSLITLEESERRDVARRTEAINAADLVILCLPDDAAREAVTLARSDKVRFIDASTAHRTDPVWTYGLPEYQPRQPGRIREARLVSNPGCYPTGAILLLYPLLRAGVLDANYPYCINAVSGYSGGGKKLIAAFEDRGAAGFTETPARVYGLGLEHKHVPEIQHYAGLGRRPVFLPSVGRFRQGMIVQIGVQLEPERLPASQTLQQLLGEYYAGQRFVEVPPFAEPEAPPQLDVAPLIGTDAIHLYAIENRARSQAVLVAVLDNLGKGASGAAVQNLDLMLGL